MSMIGRMVGYAGLGLAITAATGITAALIAEKAIPPELRDQALCATGNVDLAGQTCLSQRMAEFEELKEAELAGIRQHADAQVQAADDARAIAEHSLVGRMVFVEGPGIAGMTVIVGTTYQDYAARTGFVRSICWGTHDKPGLDPRVTLAQMGPDGAPTAMDVDAFEMSSLGVGQSDVEAARAACPWPGAS